MATRLEKSGGLMSTRGGFDGPATGKPKDYLELGLCLALIVLVPWALFAGLHKMDWAAVSHVFKVILAAIS